MQLEHVEGVYGHCEPNTPKRELHRQVLGGMPMGLPVGPSLWHFFCHWVLADGDPRKLEEKAGGWMYRVRTILWKQWETLFEKPWKECFGAW